MSNNPSTHSLPAADPEPEDAPPSPTSETPVATAPTPPPESNTPPSKDDQESKDDPELKDVLKGVPPLKKVLPSKKAPSSKRAPPSKKDASDTITQIKSPRSTNLSRTSTSQTKFMDMLLDQHAIPRIYNILASFFTWILLAGFVIFPGTFSTISDSTKKGSAFIQHVPLLIVAYVCAGIGGLGMLWLWWVWRRNYVWLLNKIFLPGCLNSSAGLLSTLVNIYFQHSGPWSITAKATVCITGGGMVITGTLFIIYDFWVLRKIKKKHSQDIASGAASAARKEGKGFINKIAGLAMGSAMDPGSVV